MNNLVNIEESGVSSVQNDLIAIDAKIMEFLKDMKESNNLNPGIKITSIISFSCCLSLFIFYKPKLIINYHWDKPKVSICPPGFPNLERHSEANHGDVCRNEKLHGFNKGWVCPAGCIGMAIVAPFCRKSGPNRLPCRVAGKFWREKYMLPTFVHDIVLHVVS